MCLCKLYTLFMELMLHQQAIILTITLIPMLLNVFYTQLFFPLMTRSEQSLKSGGPLWFWFMMLGCFSMVLRYSSHLCLIPNQGYMHSTLSRAPSTSLRECGLGNWIGPWLMVGTWARCQDVYGVVASRAAVYTSSVSRYSPIFQCLAHPHGQNM